MTIKLIARFNSKSLCYKMKEQHIYVSAEQANQGKKQKEFGIGERRYHVDDIKRISGFEGTNNET